MKHSPLVLILAMLFQATFAIGQAHALGPDWAEKMFSDKSHDFGVVARGAETVHRVKIKNLYKQPIQISSVTTSCSCTQAEIEKRTLGSLEEAELIISIDTKRFMRQKNTTVTVNFGGDHVATVRYPISVYIRTDVVLTPGSASFGRVDQGEKADRKLTLTYAGRPDWSVQSVETDHRDLSAKVIETARENGTVNYDITITAKSSLPIGDFRGQITLITDDANNPKVPILVEGSVVPDIIITPSVVSLGVMNPGESKDVNIVIRGKKPFAITDITCEAKDLAQLIAPESMKNVHVVPIRITPSSQTGTLDEEFTVKIEGRKEPLTFKAYGKVVSK